MVVATHRPSRILISKAAVAKNLKVMRESSQAKFIFLTVKANAYGFGLLEMSQAAVEGGADGLAVAVLDEAIALRKAGFCQPILVLGLTPVDQAQLLADYEIIATVADRDWLATANELLRIGGPKLQVNLAVDTGMGRIGFRSRDELSQAITDLEEDLQQLTYQSIMTHFATADDVDTTYFTQQVATWHELTDGLTMPPLVHLANSAAALYRVDAIPTDVIRAGTSVYGVEPSAGEIRADDYLAPVLTLQSAVAMIKQLPKGASVSYGATYQTTKDQWVATLPIGYGDGLPREAQGFEVLVNGKKAPIIGQLAMDQLMIAVDEPVPVGTPVTFIGTDGDQEITIWDFSRYCQIDPWELTIRFQARLNRELVD
ncbi:alanine racemase [Fructobacillus pseudoficulneus]|uniref:Alanine racemase n=1 Tax=Fructobacillus pseudoficulneus TaxID=220714 RepID=A0A3F3H261_9LACO|nr:alanine racemase [Fructobacillus pseudoficulneus]GAP02658.1 alanine racemase [Fructobacillus pseudoficulneus]SEH38863.1 alanine racemase [Fructobacillus pseudoficulneus]